MDHLTNIEVNVTTDQINQANHGCICSCPIANSIKRSLTQPPDFLPKIDDVSVHLEDGWFTLHERNPQTTRIVRSLYKFNLPMIACEFVAAWDARRPVTPINFDLPLTFSHIRDNISPSTA